MSITVAVNAADSTNGPQAVCQTVQHNNCVEYNGGVGDMAVFDHEKGQHEQVLNNSWLDVITIILIRNSHQQYKVRIMAKLSLNSRQCHLQEYKSILTCV